MLPLYQFEQCAMRVMDITYRDARREIFEEKNDMVSLYPGLPD